MMCAVEKQAQINISVHPGIMLGREKGPKTYATRLTPWVPIYIYNNS